MSENRKARDVARNWRSRVRVYFLLTWNSTHIANAELRSIVEPACRDSGYAAPILCTPDELMGG